MTTAPDQPARAASVLDLPPMPMASPSRPRGPERFVQRACRVVADTPDDAPPIAGALGNPHATTALAPPSGRVIHHDLAT